MGEKARIKWYPESEIIQSFRTNIVDMQKDVGREWPTALDMMESTNDPGPFLWSIVAQFWLQWFEKKMHVEEIKTVIATHFLFSALWCSRAIEC